MRPDHEQQLLRRAIRFFNSEVAARWWLSTPKLALGGNSPLQEGRTREGLRHVEALMARMRPGTHI